MSTSLSPAELPPAPYRLTSAEFEAIPVPAIQLERRNAIRDLAAALFAANLDGTGLEKIKQGDPLAEPIHHVSKGMRARELHLAAGTRVVGMRHHQEHINVISKGRATVMTEHGREEVSAGDHFISPAGTQRVVIVHEDMIWTTFHRCDEEDNAKALAFIFMDETPLIADKIKKLEVGT